VGRGTAGCLAALRAHAHPANVGSAAVFPCWASAMLWCVCYDPHSRSFPLDLVWSPSQMAMAGVVPTMCFVYYDLHNTYVQIRHTSSPIWNNTHTHTRLICETTHRTQCSHHLSNFQTRLWRIYSWTVSAAQQLCVRHVRTGFSIVHYLPIVTHTHTHNLYSFHRFPSYQMW